MNTGLAGTPVNVNNNTSKVDFSMSEHQMSDSHFGKIFRGALAAMVALTIVLIIIANVVGCTPKDEMASLEDQAKAKELVARIEPIGKVKFGKPAQVEQAQAAPVAKAETISGEATYNSACAACHAQGVVGAPKFADGGAWNERVAKGKDTLYTNAIKGFQGKAGYMPPKGGNAGLSDDQVKAAVDYIVDNIK
jgi:cytochrome c5